MVDGIMTYEFTFPGGSAIITTATGGTVDNPDFCVSGPDGVLPFEGEATAVFAAELLRLTSRKVCRWSQQDHESGDCWETDCGGTFGIDEGTPSENGMKFCCYCGAPLAEEKFVPDEEDDDVHD
jgi:hypothetical protein